MSAPHSTPVGPFAKVLKSLVLKLVRNHEAVDILTADTATGYKISISVGPADQSRIIGSQGRIINGLKLLAQAHSEKLGRPIDLILATRDKGENQPERALYFDPNFNISECDDILSDLMELVHGGHFIVPANMHQETIFTVNMTSSYAVPDKLKVAIEDIFRVYGAVNGRRIKVEFAR